MMLKFQLQGFKNQCKLEGKGGNVKFLYLV